MKKLITIIALICCFANTSCDKIPENGPLDGQWQLLEISDNEKTTDVKDQRLYVSFQLKLFMLGSKHEGPRAYFGRFERNADKLRFYSFTYRSDYSSENQSEDRLITDEELDVIAPWGFYSTDSTFDIELLNSSTLVLRHNSLRLTYRKN